MSDESQILVASHSESALGALQRSLASLSGVRVEALLMTNGNDDPLAGTLSNPDLLVLHDDGHNGSLELIGRRPESSKPALIVVANNPQPETVKHAVRAGARDFLAEGDLDKLSSCVEEQLSEMAGDGEPRGAITSVINAKGGSGGTFLTCNLGHITGQNSSGSVLVLDLDFQFASLPHYFDVAPKRSLLDALANARELDRVAVEGYTVEHSSGVAVMAPNPDTTTSADFDIGERVQTLLPILKSRYQHVIVDVPRHLDHISTPILEASDNILIVLQQSLPSVRDAVRLKTTLIRDLAIDKDRISVIVNRYLKASTIEISDMRDALGEENILQVPNHYKAVAQSIDLGVPLAEYAPSSPVVKALSRLQARLHGGVKDARQVLPVNEAVSRLKQWSPF